MIVSQRLCSALDIESTSRKQTPMPGLNDLARTRSAILKSILIWIGRQEIIGDISQSGRQDTDHTSDVEWHGRQVKGKCLNLWLIPANCGFEGNSAHS